MADRLRDTAIRNLVEQALVTFTDDAHAEQHTYWPGFALYCMEVAVGFIHMHEKYLGRPPDGISRDALQAKTVHASSSITYREIKEYVSRTKTNPDVDALKAYIDGSLDPVIQGAQEKAAQAAEEVEELTQRLMREQMKTSVLDRHMKESMADLKLSVRRIEQMSLADGTQLNLIHKMLDTITKEKLAVVQKYLS